MKEPELSFFQQLIAFAALAGLGGVVHYLTTLKTGKKFKWPSFFIELICSALNSCGYWLIFYFNTYAYLYGISRGRSSWSFGYSVADDA